MATVPAPRINIGIDETDRAARSNTPAGALGASKAAAIFRIASGTAGAL